MVQEQSKDSEILELKTVLAHGDPSRAIKRRYLIENDTVYFLSGPDDNPTLRLYIPEQLRQLVVKQYHDDKGHMDVQKTYDAIRQNIIGQIYLRNCMTIFRLVPFAKQGLLKKRNPLFKKQIYHCTHLQN